MRPAYDITSQILKLSNALSEQLGLLKSQHQFPSAIYIKHMRAKSIQATLAIDGIMLSERQLASLLERRYISGPKEVLKSAINTILAYEQLENYISQSEKSFLFAHKIFMAGLHHQPGMYRTEAIETNTGAIRLRSGPPSQQLPLLMKALFKYLKKDGDPLSIRSCVFQYETHFIQPFQRANGRMGRLWQKAILMKDYPVFTFIPYEVLIWERHEAYFDSIKASDRTGKSTAFIEFMLQVLLDALEVYFSRSTTQQSSSDRLQYFLLLNPGRFSRKDYLKLFKDISTATASRDLKKGLQEGLIIKSGEKNKTKYQIKK